ncbi:MAG: stage III sporulation protein AB [Clostridiales bacterium]|jgi:stage III sporulation protein AB|nr:stage III sporulation protein AB [Clostridiales bacterium]
MIIRILGGILVCAACALLGLYMSHRGTLRARRLAEFRQTLVMLKSEIEFAAYPLPQAFANIAQRAEGDFADFYQELSRKLADKEMGLAEAWEAGLAGLEDNHFSREDIQAMGGLGSALGSIDSAVQIKAIDMAVAAIDDILPHLTVQNAKDGKMYRRLGLLGGALITVVLL